MATQNLIVNGPSKFDLMLSLFDGDSNHRREVTLIVDLRKEATPDHPSGQNYKARVVINQIGRESGSGDSWIFEGYCNGMAGLTAVMGCYSTASRKGWIMDKP